MFTSLSQEDQSFAEIFLQDIQHGDMKPDIGQTFRDYLASYKAEAKDKEVEAIVSTLGVDATKLRALMNTHVTEANLNEYGRFDELRGTVDADKAKAHFEGLEGKPLPMFKVNIKSAKLLIDFLLRGGTELKKALPRTLGINDQSHHR